MPSRRPGQTRQDKPSEGSLVKIKFQLTEGAEIGKVKAEINFYLSVKRARKKFIPPSSRWLEVGGGTTT